MNEIERAYHEATEQWKAGFRAGVEMATEACKKAVPRAHTYASENAEVYHAWDAARDRCIQAVRSLLNEPHPDLVDEDEPDRYLDEIPRSEDERLDSPEHGQAEGLNKLR